MKRFLFFLLGAALLHSAPLTAQTDDWKEAQTTWSEVQTGVKELDGLVATRKLEKLHDAALNLRDTVRELRYGWKTLSPVAQTKADGVIRRLDSLLDEMHENADHNDVRGVVQKQRTLHVLLDQIVAAFPVGVLSNLGPVTASGDVKDPYCRMTVDTATAPGRVAYNGQTYYFCAAKEAVEFRKNPAPYAALYDQLQFGKPKVFNIALGSGRALPGQATSLVFAIRQQGQDTLVRKFQQVHERYFHLIAVSEDLSWFGHLHPKLAKDGRFYLKTTFPRAGRYLLFSDFTPADGTNQMLRSEIVVTGKSLRHAPTLKLDTERQKAMDGLDVALKIAPNLSANRQSLMMYSITKNGAPVTDFQPYLGAMGHLMAVHQNGRDVVHTHAVGPGIDAQSGMEVTPSMATSSGPNFSFKLQLPSGGNYRIWAQFQHQGKILTVPFTLKVEPGQKANQGDKMNIKTLTTLAAGAALATAAHAAPAKKAPASKVAPQKVTITLPQGYKANATTVKAGKPVALTFFLKSEAGCGNSISVPAAKWTKNLKVGEKATVTFTPKKSGPLKFACSMDMMKGSLVVK